MIKVISKVELVELNGKDTGVLDRPILTAESHWNDSSLVVLTIGETTFSVKVKDLIAAINNATNTARF